ncbi:MAG: hypothetical protein Q7S53_00545 [bacterium]|nr:hypothetical protein [bacterium]
MNDSQKIAELVKRCGKSVQILEKKRMLGFIPVTHSRGWLWIDDANDHWSVTLANGKTSHQALGSKAFAADFRKANGERKIGPSDLTGVWKSALSMWPIRDEEEAVRVFDLIVSRIDLAYSYHCTAQA